MPLNKFQTEVATLCLKKMLNSSFFSICELDRIAEMAGVSAKQHPDYNTLHTLHCVHWSDMPAGMAREVKQKTVEIIQTMLEEEVEIVFRKPSEALQQLALVIDAEVMPKKGWLDKLPWRKQ